MVDKGSALISKEFEDYVHSQNARIHPVSTGEHGGNGRLEVFIRTCIYWLRRTLGVGMEHEWRHMVAEFLANYNATYSTVIDNTPYTLETGRVYPHHTDPIVEQILDEALGCPEPTVSLRQEPLDRDLRASEAVSRARQAQKQSADMGRIDAPMYAIGREVMYTPLQTPAHKLAKEWLGPATVLAHVAPVMHFIFGKALNKEYRVHIKNLKAYRVPIGRPERRPLGRIAASAFGNWLMFSSPFADEEDNDHRQAIIAALRTSVPAMRFLYGCSSAWQAWLDLTAREGRIRDDDFTDLDEEFFLEFSHGITNATTVLTNIKKAYRFGRSKQERIKKLAAWDAKRAAIVPV